MSASAISKLVTDSTTPWHTHTHVRAYIQQKQRREKTHQHTNTPTQTRTHEIGVREEMVELGRVFAVRERVGRLAQQTQQAQRGLLAHKRRRLATIRTKKKKKYDDKHEHEHD